MVHLIGSDYRQSEISVGADQIVYNQRGINAYYGAAVGTGNNFSTDTPLYFIKGQAGFILRKKNKQLIYLYTGTG